MITELEALRACNTLNTCYATRELGIVQGHQSNWLLVAEYYDHCVDNPPPVITLVLTTRTSFGREGKVYPLYIKRDILALCQTATDVVDYFLAAILGPAKQCKAGREQWLKERKEVSKE